MWMVKYISDDLDRVLIIKCTSTGVLLHCGNVLFVFPLQVVK